MHELQKIKGIVTRDIFFLKAIRLFHVILTVYFLIAFLYVVFGKMAAYPKWNLINMCLVIVTTLGNFALKQKCPLTVWEHRLLRKYDSKIKYKHFLASLIDDLFHVEIKEVYLGILAYAIGFIMLIYHIQYFL